MPRSAAIHEVPDDWRDRVTVSVPQAGRILADLSVNSAYNAAKRGELPTIRLGARIVVPVARLLEMVGEVPSRPEPVERATA